MKKSQPDPRIDELVTALATENPLERVSMVMRTPPVDAAVVTAANARAGDRGVASAILRARAGIASDSDAQAIAECAATATSFRLPLSDALAIVAGRVEPSLLGRALDNLEIANPFAAVGLAHWKLATAARDRYQARASFLERHAAIVGDCTKQAKARAREAASAKLMKLTGTDREHAALWALLDGEVTDETKRWAAPIVLADPTVSPLCACQALEGDPDEEDARKLLAAASDERVNAVAVEALTRGWGGPTKTIAVGRPSAYRDPRVFAALLEAAARRDAHVIGQLFAACARHWGPLLDDAQAARLAETMIELLESGNSQIVSAVKNSCHYISHPGCIPVFRRALEGSSISKDARDALYDAVHSTNHASASELLVDRLFAEHELKRDMIFGYNHRVPHAWQARVLERIEREHSFHALWMFVACQVHWAHRPRMVLAAVKILQGWPGEGTPEQRAMIWSEGVKAGIELHEYDLARACLAELGERTTSEHATEAEPVDTVLAKGKPDLAPLRTKQLDAADQQVLDKMAAARAAGSSVALTDEELGVVAKGVVGWVVHRDASTNEVWFFDKEHERFHYDGSAVVPPPFEMRTLHPVHMYDVELVGLAAFCKDWNTDERVLQRSDSDFRYALRSGARILLRFSGSRPGTWQMPFALTFPDAEAASRAFASLAANPLPGFRDVDPFYVPGKRGGTYVYQYGNRTEYGFVCSKAATWGDSAWVDPKPFASHEAAVAMFTAAEADALRRGMFPRDIELEERIRPLDDMPLTKWLADRARDDDKSPSWHVTAFPALEGALAQTGLTLDHEIVVGPPATPAELDAYDATLPSPMPPEMREMWGAASSVEWRVGSRVMRLMSPSEVANQRDTLRTVVSKNAGKKANRDLIDNLDVMVLADDAPFLAFDVRQDDSDTWTTLDKRGSSSTLGHLLGWHFSGGYVEALVKLHPQLKKLNYGQSIGGEEKPTKKPAAKKR